MLSSLTIQGYIRTLKAFYSWVVREEFLERNPMRRISTPRTAKDTIDTFTDTQIRTLVSAVDISKPLGVRDRCILLILLDSGVRLSELAGLRVSYTDLERGELRVTGKGHKQRIVPVGGTVQKSLRRYPNRYRPAPSPPYMDSLLLNRSGTPMSADAIYRMVRRVGQRANIRGVRCSPHTFRHTSAKNYLLN